MTPGGVPAGEDAGVCFGPFRLAGRIGHGGMAEVLLAEWDGADGQAQRVVVKRILPQYAGDREYVEMFLDEARVLGQLRHANIARLYDAGAIEGRHYMAIEWVEGLSLAEVLDRSGAVARLGPDLGAAVLLAVCRGLAHAWICPGADGRPLEVVHRDLSPANVMIAFDGTVKLIDFGIARTPRRLAKTGAGLVKGKLAAMSPEQLDGGAVDQRSDVFAAGLLLFAATTGRRVFEGVDEFHVVQAITSGRLPSPRELRADYSPELERIYRRATQLKRQDRYQDAAAMAADLAAYLDRAGLVRPGENLARVLAALEPGQRPASVEPDALADQAVVGGRARAAFSGGDGFSAVSTQPNIRLSRPARLVVLAVVLVLLGGLGLLVAGRLRSGRTAPAVVGAPREVVP